jgi:hypothetical protein
MLQMSLLHLGVIAIGTFCHSASAQTCPGDCRMSDGSDPNNDGRLCPGGCPTSCACAQNTFCCSTWSWSCDACEAGLGNEFGCAAGACSGARMPAQPPPSPPPAAAGRPGSCACEHNSYCCSGWSSSCSDCESGAGNALGCAAGVCGLKDYTRIAFEFAKVELSAGAHPKEVPSSVNLLPKSDPVHRWRWRGSAAA